MITEEIKSNRRLFLEALRLNHPKGTIKSDERGFPVIECEEDANGKCACALFTEMFGHTNTNRLSIKKATLAIGITTKDCAYIQHKLNDTPLTNLEIADRIEKEIFHASNT